MQTISDQLEVKPQSARRLDVVNAPLDNLNLIEANAGTGKTWTITALYVRLLLEAERSVESILVVTFTESATAELRDRIRNRLAEARGAFERGSAEGDEVMAALLTRVADRGSRLSRLSAALRHSIRRRSTRSTAFASVCSATARFRKQACRSAPKILVRPERAAERDRRRFLASRMHGRNAALRTLSDRAERLNPASLADEIVRYSANPTSTPAPAAPRGWPTSRADYAKSCVSPSAASGSRSARPIAQAAHRQPT